MKFLSEGRISRNADTYQIRPEALETADSSLEWHEGGRISGAYQGVSELIRVDTGSRARPDEPKRESIPEYVVLPVPGKSINQHARSRERRLPADSHLFKSPSYRKEHGYFLTDKGRAAIAGIRFAGPIGSVRSGRLARAYELTDQGRRLLAMAWLFGWKD